MSTRSPYQIAKPNSIPKKRYTCSLCGYNFSKLKYLTNHYQLCKNIENPCDRLGFEPATVKTEHEVKINVENPSDCLGFEPATVKKEHEVEINVENPSDFLGFEPVYLATVRQVGGAAIKPTCNIDIEETEIPEHTIYRSSPDLSAASPTAFVGGTCDGAVAKSTQPVDRIKVYRWDQRLQCTVSDRAYAHRYLLKAHMITHSVQKSFKCIVCEYTCAEASRLKSHMKKHTAAKPFKCIACDYSCTESSYLKSHMRKHTGDLQFQCTVCRYACRTRETLNTHMRRHTEGRTIN